MTRTEYLPHVDLLLRGLRIGRDRLLGSAKIAIDARLLRALIQTALADAPFDAALYRATYPDIEAAHAAGDITDLHRHFVETGYFEGRCGAPPVFDEAFYTQTYHDVARAMTQGEIPSARDHYIRAGAAEGRNPSPTVSTQVAFWSDLLDPYPG